jgi:DHA2 family multidrug resistance protein
VGKNVSRIDPRKLTTVAFLGFGLVLWMRSQFNLQAPFETILIPTLLQGAAMAFFFIPLQAIVFNGMRPDEMPSAAGLSNFMRMVAGAMGTSIFTTLWESRAVLHHAHLAESMNPGNSAAQQAMAQLMAAGQSQEQAAATLMRLLDQQAYTMAVTDLFYLSSAVFLLLIGAVWLARPKTAPQGPGAPGGGAH